MGEAVLGDAEGAAVNGLLARARAALAALGDGKVRTASGLDSVKELQERLNALMGQPLFQNGGVDLRDVQESIVEHTAMYANCPEVLGGMLQLVFCLDNVRGWLEQRDLAVQETLSQLDTLQRNFEDCSVHVTDMSTEVRNCTKRAAALELELAVRGSGNMPEVRISPPALIAMSPLHSPGAGQIVSVDLLALEADEENAIQVQEHQSSTRVKELRRENSELRSRLAQAVSEASSARSAAEAAANAAEQLAAVVDRQAATTQVPASPFREMQVQELRPEPSPLELLEQLEPLLAGLPVGVVPGMSELQEEACEAYGQLRTLLMRAAAGVPALELYVEQSPRPASWEAAGPPMHTMQAPYPPYGGSQYRVQPASVYSEEQPDSWRMWPATVISDPHRGIGPNAGNYAYGPPASMQDHAGSMLRANRLS